MAIKAITLGAVWDFYSRYDTAKKKEDKTKFILGSVDSRVLAILKDKATKITGDPDNANGEVGLAYNTHDFNYNVVQFGLRGIENFPDEEGNMVAYKTEKRNIGGKSYDIASSELVSRIHGDILSEISAEILEKNILTQSEGKRSGGQS